MNALVTSMRLRTLPLSLAGVVCGGLLAMGRQGGSWWVFAFVAITACLLQILSNLSNEMGDHLSGVDGETREGPNYSMASGGLTVKQMWRTINTFVVLSALSGLAMLLLSFSPISLELWVFVLLGAAAIWAATHYTLGKRPYGYAGLGDLFVFLFFGLMSVMGSYFVVAHTLQWRVMMPACGMGFMSVAVLNVNNIRDMESDRGIRKTIPLRIGERRAKWYQTLLVLAGMGCFCWSPVLALLWAVPLLLFVLHLVWVWTHHGKTLDPALPMLVLATFIQALLYGLFLA